MKSISCSIPIDAANSSDKLHTTANNHSGGVPSGSNAGTSGAPSQPKYIVRIADSKLFYEKRWFHRGQNIYVDSKDTGKVSAVISSIGTNEVRRELLLFFILTL